MDISEDRRGDGMILALSGRLDATTARAFEEKVVGAISSGTHRLIVDLSHLDYISSAGLRVFVIAAKQLRGTNGKIVICSMKDHVREVFDLAGFSSIISIYGSRDEAYQSTIAE
jgi:anti-sigma B factor antagonist